MIRSLTRFVQKKREQRRIRLKGTASANANRSGRNRPRGDTAEQLWAKVYRFKETPPKRAGTRRRKAREREERGGLRRFLPL